MQSMNSRLCSSGVINSRLIQRLKSNLLCPPLKEGHPLIDDENNKKQLVCVGTKPPLTNVKTGYHSQFRSMILNQRNDKHGLGLGLGQGCFGKEAMMMNTMAHANSSNMIKLQQQANLPNANMNTNQTAIKLKTNNRNMTTNMNDDLYLSNYHIKSYISRTDTSRQLLREKIKQRKEHCTQPVISLALVSNRNKHKHYHSNTCNDESIKFSKYTLTKGSKITYIKAKSHFCLTQRKTKETKPTEVIEDNNKENKDNIANHMLNNKVIDIEPNETNGLFQDNVPLNLTASDNMADLFKVIKKINQNHINKLNTNQKDVFKKLRADIKRSKDKIKTLLGDLRRTQTLNDEGLKRKGFIMKIGCITGEYIK